MFKTKPNIKQQIHKLQKNITNNITVTIHIKNTNTNKHKTQIINEYSILKHHAPINNTYRNTTYKNKQQTKHT